MKFNKFNIMLNTEKQGSFIVETKGIRINDSLAVVENPLRECRKQHPKSLIHIASGVAFQIYNYCTWKEAENRAKSFVIPDGEQTQKTLKTAIEKYQKILSKDGVHKVEEMRII